MERRAHVLSGIALAAALTIVAGCAGELGTPSPSTAAAAGPIATQSRLDELKFSHATHLKQPIACLDCHSGIDQAEDLSSTYMPFHDKCARCHTQKEMTTCAKCHADPEHVRRRVPLNDGINFSHKNHLEKRVNVADAMQGRGNCIRCHAEIPRATTSAESVRPPMETCTDGCHREDMVVSNCQRCHSDLTRYALESIRYMAHGAKMVEKHGELASSPSATCNSCHERSFCSDCHSNTTLVPNETRLMDRATRTFIHPEPYTAVHALDARAKRDTCETCHRSNFCNSCHASMGLASLDRVREAPHPAGWLEPGSASFHGVQARREITACAACHDQGAASVCVRCHQVGGTGGNPHPPGFARRDEDPTKNRMCRACHWR